jgi:hypothetical protein
MLLRQQAQTLTHAEYLLHFLQDRNRVQWYTLPS